MYIQNQFMHSFTTQKGSYNMSFDYLTNQRPMPSNNRQAYLAPFALPTDQTMQILWRMKVLQLVFFLIHMSNPKTLHMGEGEPS